MKKSEFTRREYIASDIANQMASELTIEEIIELVSGYFYEEFLSWDEGTFYEQAKENYPEIVKQYK